MRRKCECRIGEGSDDADEAVDRDIRVLLHEIHGFYDKALLRLPVDRDPSIARRLRKAGFCFGSLDPVSNIIANTISYDYNSSPAEAEAEARIITDTDDEDVFEIPLPQGVAQRMSVARRSLEGLVIFLTVQFRYLPEPEALRYLRLARADLLAAVWLIELDRHGRDKPPTFSFASSTTWVALRCAAVSASHPNPDAFVRATVTLDSQEQIAMAARRSMKKHGKEDGAEEEGAEHEAVWHLLVSNAEVESAIHLARLHNQQDISCSSHEYSAYSEAAAQAWHPDPEGIADFIMSSEFCQLSMMVHGSNVHNFEFITKFLSEKKMQQTSEVLSKNQMKQTSQVLSQNQMKFVPKVHKKFQDDQEFFVRKVNAALKKYADENEESYVLHVICGVNPRVIEEPLKHGHFGRKAKFGYIHVNFLATPVARGARPVLFFAECSNKEEDEETSVCFQLGASICSMAAGTP